MLSFSGRQADRSADWDNKKSHFFLDNRSILCYHDTHIPSGGKPMHTNNAMIIISIAIIGGAVWRCADS